MYSPAAFKVGDRDQLIAFTGQHSVATIVTHDGIAPHATQVPALFREGGGTNGILASHLARTNPRWRHFENRGEVPVLFTGPHAYISPAW